MQPWLLIAAASHVAATNVGAELKGLAPGPARHISGHSIDFRLRGPLNAPGLMFQEIDLDRQIAPGAQVGVGMSSSSDAIEDQGGIGEQAAHQGSRAPAINFVLKF